ncbi:MAG: LLM class flavin-dependent oxidoreductase [Chloroflexota bacterium]|nr:LLM class flavin-dependent oxidoreductase [Chloroflexota bacterium]
MKREVSIAFQTDKTPAQYVALAQLVNRYDFDAVTVYCDASFQPSFGPLLLMAPHIERARLGPAAVAPSRIHPLDMAAETALLAQLARGGVYLGIARGAWLEQHGIHELTPPVQAIRESIDIVRYLLEGRTGGYNGHVFTLAAHVRAPYLLPAHMPRILVGSWGEKLCAVAGELADEVKIGGSANPDVVPVIQRYIATGEQRAGRAQGSVGVVVGAVSVCDEDREAARYAARRSVALYLPVVAPLDPTVQVEPELIARLQALADQHAYDEAARLISDDLLERFAFAGNPADLIRQAEALYAAGAQRVEFGTPHGLSAPDVGVRLIGEQVVPALKTT